MLNDTAMAEENSPHKLKLCFLLWTWDGREAFLPVIVQVSVEQVLQAVLQAVEHKLSMEIQATGSAVFWHRVRILQDSSEARQPVQQELKIFQLRTNKNSFSARKKKKNHRHWAHSSLCQVLSFSSELEQTFPLRKQVPTEANTTCQNPSVCAPPTLWSLQVTAQNSKILTIPSLASKLGSGI